MNVSFKNKLLAFGTILFCLLSMAEAGEKTHREEIEFSGPGWNVWMDQQATWKDDKIYLPSEIDDISNLPHNVPTCGWEKLFENGQSCEVPLVIEEFFSKSINTWRYHGVSWFAKKFNVPSSWNGRSVRIRFADTRLRAELYVNEDLAGYSIVAEVPWEADISEYLKYGRENTIALRITNPGGAKDFDDTVWVEWGEYKIPASHDFGGIGGPVNLIVTDDTYIDDVFIKNMFPAGGKNIDVISSIKNHTMKEQTFTLGIEIACYTTGKTVYTNTWTEKVGANMSADITKSLQVSEAKLWGLSSPNLYNCKVTISSPEVNDELVERFGFRVFEIREVNGRDDIYLNGSRVRAKSAIDWGYYAPSGYYTTDEQAARDVQNALDVGHNALNFHRQIGEPLVMKHADEKGLLIYEEPGSNRAGAQGYTLVADTWSADYMEEKCRRMVRRDKNHPSLYQYNLANEGNVWTEFRERVMRQIHSYDETRIITNTSGGFDVKHMRPYEDAIRDDWDDEHPLSSTPRFNEKDLTCWMEFNSFNNCSEIVYWGEVRHHTGPSNFYLTSKLFDESMDGRVGYDNNIYKPLHDKILTYFNNNNLRSTGSKTIKSPEDVTIQAGRGLMYINGRISQALLASDCSDGYAINGWSNGPHINPNHYGDWDSAICDEGRHLKGPASDIAYWNRPLQIAIFRQNGKYFQIGEKALFDVYLINEGKLPAGKYNLKLSIKDGNGTVTSFFKEISVDVEGGIVYAQKFIDDFAVVMDSKWHGGYITILGELYSGSTIAAYGTEQVLLQNRPSYYENLTPFKGAVFSWDAAKKVLSDTGVKIVDFSTDTQNLDYICAGGNPTDDELDNMLQKTFYDGTCLIINFDEKWATKLYNKALLAQPVLEWGGEQTGGWNGNGWGYLDYYIGNQAIPSGSTIGTNSWEVPGDPRGFWPFESAYETTSYGAYFWRTDTFNPGKLLVLIGEIKYGKGKIILAPSYAVGTSESVTNIVGDQFYSNGSWGYTAGRTWPVDTPVSNNYGYPQAMKSQRIGTNFTYKFDLPNGQYNIKLYFSENFHNESGKRVFDVITEGNIVQENYDPFQYTGGKLIGQEGIYEVEVKDNQLEIEFVAKVDTAVVNVIKIESKEGTPPYFKEINCGGSMIRDLNIVGEMLLFNYIQESCRNLPATQKSI